MTLMKRNGRIFRRYFLIYALFFVCTAMMMVPTYVLSLHEVEQRTLETTGSVLTSGLTLIEESMSAVCTAADALYQNHKVYDMKFIEEPLAASHVHQILDAQNTYKNITLSLPMVRESGMLLENGSLFLSGQFYTDAEFGFSAICKPPTPMRFSQWVDSLHILGKSYAASDIQLTVASSHIDGVVFCIALPLNSQARNCFFFALYEKNELLQQLLLPQYINACSLSMSDSTGNPLLHYGQTPGRYVSITKRSPLFGLEVTMQIDTAVFSQEMSHFRQIMLICLLVYLLVGIMIVILYAYQNTKPIAAVLQATESIGRETGIYPENQEQVSPYKSLHNFITHLGKEMLNTQQTVSYQLMELRKGTMEQLLRGELFLPEDLAKVKQFFPDFPQSFQMLVLRVPYAEHLSMEATTTARLQINKILREAFSHDALIYFLDSICVVFLPWKGNFSLEDRETFLANIAADMLKKTDLEVKFAISDPMDDMGSIPQVYYQLLQLLHIAGATGERILHAANASMAKIDLSVCSSERFYEMLVKGDWKSALSCMELDILRIKKLKYVSENDIQQLFYIYRYELSRVLQLTQRYEESAIAELPAYQSNLSVEERFKPLQDSCVQLAEHILNLQKQKEESFERQILLYIDNHLNDPALCIQQITDQFSISEATLRAVLQKLVGVNYKEYVDEKRMTMAQYLLEHSSQPVSQIPLCCGYSSANTFYKAFKRHFDCTPSEMRDKMQRGL